MNWLSKKFIVTCLFILTPCYLFSMITIKGKVSDVNIDKFINSDKKYDEQELRRLCVEITDLYHSLGYSAFYIKKATIKKNGDVELEFIDPIVSEVKIHCSNRAECLVPAEAIYKTESPFNEKILQQKINELKDLYSLKKVSAKLLRDESENIIIDVTVEKKLFNSQIFIFAHPVYDLISSISIGYGEEKSEYLHLAASASSNQDEIFYKSAALSFYKAGYGNLKFFGDSEIIQQRCNGYFDNLFVSAFMGSEYIAQYFSFSFAPGITYATIKDSEEKGFSFSGIKLNFTYSDEFSRIDPFEMKVLMIDFFSGWDSLEGIFFVKEKLYGEIRYPIYNVTALTFGIMSYGTNENNPNFHQLLFTENFPVIANDYTTVQFLFIPYWGFLFDLYNRKLLLGGKFFHGIYFSQSNENYINCTSIYLTFKSSDIILEVSYNDNSIKELEEFYIYFKAGVVF